MHLTSDIFNNEPCDSCPIDLVKQRASYVVDNLTEEEREFLWLVRAGDLQSTKTLLQNNPHLNPDCCDYKGQRALEIAVSSRDLEIVEYLLDSIRISHIHYYCAILKAVIENEPNILELLLDRAEEDNKLYGRLRDLIAGNPQSIQFLPEVAVTNLTPTMAAAIHGNVDITRILLERGYCIQKPHSPKCRCRERCLKKAKGGETLTESISRMNAYQALSSPTYLILTSEDPILAAFEMCYETKKLSRELPENQKDYKDLSRQCSKFAADILNQCRNTEEVQTVLVQTRGLNDARPHKFSRLHLAVQCEQKEFVTHSSCQQVLRSMWIGNLGSWYSWSYKWQTFHIIKHAILTPLVSAAFIFIPKSEVIGPLRVPLNRFIYSATSYLFFLCLLMVTLLNDRRYDVQSPVSWTETAVCCYVIGHSWDIFTNLLSVGFSNYFRSWWSVFDLLMFTLFLSTEGLWWYVFLYKSIFLDETQSSNRMTWAWYHPILLGEGIYAAASVMAFLRPLLWFQLHSRLGPLGTTLKDMMVDVARFFMIFFIIMLAFATGINSIYKNYRDSSRIEDDEVLEQPEAFLTLQDTFKNLFWAIFGMGEPDFAQIVVSRNVTSNSTEETQDHEHIFTEGIGYSLWGLYNLVTVVVLLNMLIAMMTESYQRVQTNADMEWKFACSTLWLSVFDNHSVIPPPFNLVPSMHRLVILGRWIVDTARGTSSENQARKLSCSAKRCCYWDLEIDQATLKAEKDKYEVLMVQLIRRYLHCNASQQNPISSPGTAPDFKERLKTEIVQDLQRTMKLTTRRYTRKRRTNTNASGTSQPHSSPPY